MTEQYLEESIKLDVSDYLYYQSAKFAYSTVIELNIDNSQNLEINWWSSEESVEKVIGYRISIEQNLENCMIDEKVQCPYFEELKHCNGALHKIQLKSHAKFHFKH